ncbi:UNVERIFIED_ORG: phosphoglycerol transferase MdoB-like AlkP superfamily enzyme [Rhizobium esperanzae]
MATQFQSAARRSYWFSILFSSLVDFVVAFVIALFFDNTAGQAFIVALIAIAVLYIFQLLYALLGVIKVAILFYWFDKKKRVQATVDEMIARRMPKPVRFYADASEYLLSVVKSDTANNDAKLYAGAALGSIDTLRATNHSYQLINLGLVLEEAIKEYGRLVGFVWEDGSDIAPEDLAEIER